ncbi:MAG: pantoate--beta-alanine ligase [Anaerolineae bacterium]|nr:pantoate--beta-alanine ligase [Anaerolineae bacterium]
MNVAVEISDLRRERRADSQATWGLVPTMGYLHEGHLSLVRRARQENDRVGVSIFVNPSQFNDPADLAVYPTDLDHDLALLEAEGVDVVWTPTPQIVYPDHYQTYIEVEQVTRPLEGASRPGHFRGVATVVAKLFNVFQPQRAYFGQKDAQQVVVIRRMVEDLNFDIDLIICPTVREPDGLALSSRNVNLSPKARAQAPALYEALTTAQAALLGGEREAKTLRQMMERIINAAPLAKIDYISIADPTTLAELEIVENGALLSMAVWVGGVRLIDNLMVTISD